MAEITRAPGRKRADGVARPLIAASAAMQQVLARIDQYGPTHTPVLLRGEPGTGKDGVARALHAASPRRDGPFVKLCCDHVQEEEVLFLLLGDRPRSPQAAGALALARQGTLFFSEIGHFSPRLQQLLLQVIQQTPFFSPLDQTLHRGESRLVCASACNLEQQVAEGRFLPALYYRLHVATIALPALRERREDIPALAADIIQRFNQRNHSQVTLSEAAMSPLWLCQWPGNLRDLENCLEYAALHREQDVIAHLPCISGQCLRKQLNLRIDHCARQRAPAPQWDPCAAPSQVQLPPADSITGNDADDAIRHRFIAALEKSGWVKAKAARLLNITPRQLYYALQKLNIDVRKF